METTLSTTPSQVSTLAPAVTVNEEVDPPTITVGLNGKTASANLPISQPTISSESEFVRIESVSDFTTMFNTIQSVPDNSLVLLTIVNGYSRPSNNAYSTDGLTVGCVGVKTTDSGNVVIVTGGVAHTGSIFTTFEQFIPINKITFSANEIQLTMYTNGGVSTAELSTELDSSNHAIRVVLTKIL